MRPRRQHFGKSQMTKAYNIGAYNRWLLDCTDKALASADTTSIARSYGLSVEQVKRDVAAEALCRLKPMADFVGVGM